MKMKISSLKLPLIGHIFILNMIYAIIKKIKYMIDILYILYNNKIIHIDFISAHLKVHHFIILRIYSLKHSLLKSYYILKNVNSLQNCQNIKYFCGFRAHSL